MVNFMQPFFYEHSEPCLREVELSVRGSFGLEALAKLKLGMGSSRALAKKRVKIFLDGRRYRIGKLNPVKVAISCLS